MISLELQLYTRLHKELPEVTDWDKTKERAGYH